MNNILFGTIGVLMLSITTLGVAELKVQSHSAALAEAGQTVVQADAQTDVATDITAQMPARTVGGNIAQAAEKVTAAFSGNWEEGDERDFDDDDDDREERGTQAQAQTQTTAQTAATTKPAAAQTSTTAGSFSMAQVAAHNSAASCYSAINGNVYDLTAFISRHPGGAAAIKSLCGVDGTAAYNGQHGGSSRPANELASLKIGVLAQ